MKKEITLTSKHNNRAFSFDLKYQENDEAKPVIIFIHGFKGYKDWGQFNLVADFFSENEFAFVKINLSHNGTTPHHPTEFVDLEAFGNNNFSIELDDIDVVINHLFDLKDPQLDLSKIYLIGHSKGGSTSIMKAAEDARIKKLCTWSAVGDVFNRYTQDIMGEWKKNGVMYVYNGRTDQNMPLYYQLAEDLLKNKDRLDIEKAEKSLSIPHLIVHAEKDESVLPEEGELLLSFNPKAQLEIIEGANHTFGGREPWTEKKLPEHTLEACQKTLNFFTS